MTPPLSTQLKEIEDDALELLATVRRLNNNDDHIYRESIMRDLKILKKHLNCSRLYLERIYSKPSREFPTQPFTSEFMDNGS